MQCLSNLKQVGIVLKIHQQDNNNLIFPYDWVDAPHPVGKYWPSRLRHEHYLDNNRPISFCPSGRPHNRQSAVEFNDNKWGSGSSKRYRMMGYGMRNWAAPSYDSYSSAALTEPKRANVIKNPSDFWTVADSYMVSWGGVQGYQIIGSNWTAGARHNGAINTLFDDGHASAISPETLKDISDQQKEYYFGLINRYYITKLH